MILTAFIALVQLSPVIQVDDGRLLREARKAQVRFETVRRAHLPRDRWSGSPGRCDAQIGRYCYWYDSTRLTAVPEPRQISEARSALIGQLDSSAALNPADGWIAGQRVRYLIEGGRFQDAVSAARGCRADDWWCTALEGLALHVAERYTEADSVYKMALGMMTPTQRCEWIDVRPMTEGPLVKELSRASCVERETLANELWELSRPLWSFPGNDLRTEHFARHTMAGVLERSANTHGLTWSGDSRELLLRYGWAERYTRQGYDIGDFYSTPRVTGHDREPSYYFFPAVTSVRNSARLTSESWRLRDPLANSRYAPRYLEGLSDLPHQLARFPRGDSMFVAVAYRIVDTALAKDSLAAWLCHSEPDQLQIPHCVRDDKAMVPGESIAASIEVYGKHSKRAARARYTIDALPCAGPWCLSDLVLFDASGSAVTARVDSVMRRASAELRFTNRAPLGVFWEMQGAAGSAAPIWLSLTVSPLRSSIVRRIATRLKLAPELAPVRLRWQTTLRNDREGQVLTLQLPRNARGRYRVLLTLEAPDAQALSAVRDIELLP